MSDIIDLPQRDFRLGEKKTVGLKDLHNALGTSVSSSTGLMFLYNSGGTSVGGFENGKAMTVASTPSSAKCTVTRALTTGTGMEIATAGSYRAEYQVTRADNAVFIWQQKIVVAANPS